MYEIETWTQKQDATNKIWREDVRMVHMQTVIFARYWETQNNHTSIYEERDLVCNNHTSINIRKSVSD